LYDKQFGNTKVDILNPASFIEIIDTSSNVFVVKFEARNSNSNILGLTDTSSRQLVQSMIKSITIPNVGFDDSTYRRGGYLYHEAGDISIGDCTITSYNDISSNVYFFWSRWFETIIRGKQASQNLSIIQNLNIYSANAIGGADNYRLFPEEYKINIKIWKLFRSNNDKMQEIILNGCYPSSIDFTDLNWDSKDIVPEFTVNLKVDKMYTNTFSTQAAKFNLSIQSNVLNEVISNTINLDKYENKIESFLKDTGSQIYNSNKDLIKTKFNRFKGSIKTKLEVAQTIMINNLKERLRAEITKRLPADLRNLNFFNLDRLIEQILSKADGWIRGKLLGGSQAINEAVVDRPRGGKDEFDYTPAVLVDMNALVEKILDDWDIIVRNSPTDEVLVRNLTNWSPTISNSDSTPIIRFDPPHPSTDDTPDIVFNPTKNSSVSVPGISFNPTFIAPKAQPSIEFNPTKVNYEEAILRSEKAKEDILKGIKY
jgi:hypothetical protein